MIHKKLRRDIQFDTHITEEIEPPNIQRTRFLSPWNLEGSYEVPLTVPCMGDLSGVEFFDLRVSGKG